MTRKFCCS